MLINRLGEGLLFNSETGTLFIALDPATLIFGPNGITLAANNGLFTVDPTSGNVTLNIDPATLSVGSNGLTLSPDLLAAIANGGGGGGGSGTASYSHTFATPAEIWTVNHNLGTLHPNVTCHDSLNNELIGTVDIVNLNTLTVTFVIAVAGSVYITN